MEAGGDSVETGGVDGCEGSSSLRRTTTRGGPCVVGDVGGGGRDVGDGEESSGPRRTTRSGGT